MNTDAVITTIAALAKYGAYPTVETGGVLWIRGAQSTDLPADLLVKARDLKADIKAFLADAEEQRVKNQPRCPYYPQSHARFWRRADGIAICDTCHPCSVAETPREHNQTVLDNHPGRMRLLDELRRGVVWMNRAVDRWDELGPSGDLDPDYHTVLVEWQAKEKLLRQLFHFTGCIFAPGRCQPASAVSCDACVPTGQPNDVPNQ